MRKGQALIVILLVLAVALTVGLAVVSRTVTDISTSTTQEESSRALSAAEAGVEAALSGTTPPSQVGASILIVNTQDYRGDNNKINIIEPLSAGESATIFLANHDVNGDLDLVSGLNVYSGNSLVLCWGTVSGNPRPAIEASLYYKSGSTYQVTRYAYDPESPPRGGFTAADSTINSTCPAIDPAYLYSKTITGMPAGKILLRVRLLYNGEVAHYVGVSGTSQFPVQGKNITSQGTDGNTSRKIEVFQRYPDLSPLLDSAVFSGGGLVK